MGIFKKLAGIVGNVFQLGITGPKLKDNSGAIESRNADDSAYAIHRAASPVGDNDLVTKSFGTATYLLWNQNGSRFSNEDYVAAGEIAKLVGDVADGAAAVAIILDNKTALSTVGAKLASIRNANVEKLYITEEGHPVLADTVWDDFVVTTWVDESFGAARKPDFKPLVDDGAGSVGVFAWFFDDNLREDLFFTAQLPHKWKPGSTVRFHIHWLPTTNDTGTVRWGLEYVASEIGGAALGNTTIIYAEQAGNGTALKQQLAPFAGIDMSGFTESCLIFGRIFRDASHANDTFNGDAIVGSSDFHLEIEKLGTKNYSPPWDK